MKLKLLAFLAAGFCMAGCAGKQPKTATENPADTPATAAPAGHGKIADRYPDRDTVVYRLPECALVRTDTLPAGYANREISMWTERSIYWPEVRVIDVFVANPTDRPLSFGRGWNLKVWKAGKWELPDLKVADLVWQLDGFMVEEAPLLYLFRFPVGDYYRLPAGKYRLEKTFYKGLEGRQGIPLKAEFEIK